MSDDVAPSMITQTQFITCTYGQWVQICDYRESRTSLMVQLIDGAMILGYQINSPMVTTQFGSVPAGIWHSAQVGTGVTPFVLTINDNGEMVKQKWFAWVIPVATTTMTISASGAGTFVVPANVTSITLECVGGGGSGADAGASGAAEAGGGGAAYSRTVYASTPGETLTYTVGPGLNGGVQPASKTWISNTGSAPISVTHGCLADGGLDVVSSMVGGKGGKASNCVGDVSISGANGGDGLFVGGSAVSGGSGGGSFNPAISSSSQVAPTVGGTATLNGAVVPGGSFGGGASGQLPPNGTNAPNAIAGVSGGGGGGGASSAITSGSRGFGGDGWIKLTYAGGTGVVPSPIVTVIESFTVINGDDPSYVTVTLPLLTPGGQQALQDLRSKYNEQNQGSSTNVIQND